MEKVKISIPLKPPSRPTKPPAKPEENAREVSLEELLAMNLKGPVKVEREKPEERLERERQEKLRRFQKRALQSGRLSLAQEQRSRSLAKPNSTKRNTKSGS